MNNGSSSLVSTLLEYWATEKDYEIKNQLLNNLIHKYTLTIKKLVEVNELKNRFLGIAAHDLRNPLASIRGLSEIISSEAMGPLNEDQKEYLGVIQKTADSLLTLVNDLLDFSVIESGNLELQGGEHSLKELLLERIRIQRVLAEGKGITLCENLADVPLQYFDWNKIAQVTDNLIGNAIKFSPKCSRILIELDEQSDFTEVRVCDEGPGIPEKDRLRIFDAFEKVIGIQPTGGEKSTGLGLAIVKKIVEAHCGILKVESRQGAGSVFSFTLPLGNGK